MNKVYKDKFMLLYKDFNKYLKNLKSIREKDLEKIKEDYVIMFGVGAMFTLTFNQALKLVREIVSYEENFYYTKDKINIEKCYQLSIIKGKENKDKWFEIFEFYKILIYKSNYNYNYISKLLKDNLNNIIYEYANMFDDFNKEVLKFIE